jgi:hypothetical protein
MPRTTLCVAEFKLVVGRNCGNILDDGISVFFRTGIVEDDIDGPRMRDTQTFSLTFSRLLPGLENWSSPHQY